MKVKIPKKTQKIIDNFLMSNYGLSNIKYFSAPKNDYFMSSEVSVEVEKRPVIGAAKDVYNYTLKCSNLSSTNIILKDLPFDNFITDYIKEINSINYIVRNDRGIKVNVLGFTNFSLTLYNGLIDDIEKPFKPFIGFWVGTSNGNKLSYVIVKSDLNILYSGKEYPISEFKNLVINEYCRYIAKFDEYFEMDSLEKDYDQRISDLRDTLTLKEMIEL